MSPDGEVHLPHHQEKAASRLLKEFSADKLRINMEVNGYLPIDRIVVRKLSENVYVVLEGNRRIAAARTIGNYASDGAVISDEVKESLVSIPCLLYTGDDPEASWIFQGLRHIVGVNDWSSFNKARLLVEQMEREELSLTEVGKRFGLTAFGAGQWVRGYRAYKQAREETDYVSEIDDRIYPYFQELFGRSSAPMKEWMKWDDSKRRFEDTANLNEFVSWFYPRPDGNEDHPDEHTATGDWYKRKVGKQDDIRQLSYLLTNAPKYFDVFRSELDLEKAYSRARFEQIEKEQGKEIASAESVLGEVEHLADLLEKLPINIVKDAALRVRLDAHISKIERAISVIRS